jgi:DNA-binding transcriptional regulator YiaG
MRPKRKSEKNYHEVNILLDTLDILCTERYITLTMKSHQVRKLRQALKLTQEEFAAKIGTTRGSVARWENGTHEPRGLYLKALQELEKKVKK